jgi:hypothetical protein
MNIKAMKNLNLSIILCLAFIVTLQSCGEKITYYKLSDAEMEWLHYDNNQQLYFQSPNGDVIQYDIIIRVKSYNTEGNVYSEFTAADITQVDDTTLVFAGDNKGKLLISKVEESLLVTQTWPHFPLKEFPINNITPSLVNIAGLNFGDVMVLDGSLLADNRNYISKLWISKSLGVLQMEDINGTLWVRNL